MSEEQAKQTEDEIVTTETTEDENPEVEIVSSGEEQPSSKVPIGLRKRFNKLNGKIDAANTVADEERRKREMVEEENKLLRLQSQQSNARPDEDDFDTRKEYLAALDKYDETRIESIAQKQAAQIVQASHTQTATATQDAKLHTKIEAHYERANTLNMSNYEELEDAAIDILGNDFSKVIMSNTARSHLIMGHLGANPGKAQKLAELLKVDPVGAFTQAVEIGAELSIKPKTSPAPDPETTVDSGVSPSSEERGPKGAKYE